VKLTAMKLWGHSLFHSSAGTKWKVLMHGTIIHSNFFLLQLAPDNLWLQHERLRMCRAVFWWSLECLVYFKY